MINAEIFINVRRKRKLDKGTIFMEREDHFSTVIRKGLYKVSHKYHISPDLSKVKPCE